jgi:hypothetical protein
MAPPGQLDTTCRHDDLDRVSAPKRTNVKAFAAVVLARRIGSRHLTDVGLALLVHG